MSNGQGPTVRRRIVASELRRLRAEADVLQHVAAHEIGLEPSTLSRYEQARSSMAVPVAEKAFVYYGVAGEQLDGLLELVRGSRQRGWLADIKGKVWQPLEDLVALERDSSSIQETAIQVIPGPFQTEEYARAILSAGIIGAEVEQHVQSRMARAEILHRADPVDYWVILRESAVRCAVGGAPTMRRQIQHLIDLATKPNVTLQVIPDRAGEHIAMSTSFSILRFKVAPSYAVVYLDYHTGALYLDTEDEITRYDHAYRHLIKTALPEKASLELLAMTSKELFT